MSKLKHATTALLDALDTADDDKRYHALRHYRDAVIDAFVSDLYEAYGELEPIVQDQPLATGMQLLLREVVRLQTQWESHV